MCDRRSERLADNRGFYPSGEDAESGQVFKSDLLVNVVGCVGDCIADPLAVLTIIENPQTRSLKIPTL